jgi:hypothetical protein
MASYLRPRRGKKSTAESQGLVLKRGEVFFECPDTGVGTGAGKIKVGDGSTAYSSLPYFLEQTNVENSTIGFTDTSSATASSNNATYLTNIKPANSLKTIFTNLKQLLYNYNSQLTSLNNDLIKAIVVSNKTSYTINAGNAERIILNANNSPFLDHKIIGLCFLSIGEYTSSNSVCNLIIYGYEFNNNGYPAVHVRNYNNTKYTFAIDTIRFVCFYKNNT